eukprot:TRINITY_DN36739_c0_g1_i1.p1 TRINITY_DN36739_c0_g1~~TRINITY_DN36739_c0_g1_i1.p1  ORF type:complete len:566 (-),score=51.09 TRINITY_DN36739_c0_g1_i1:229-1926(-)
MIIPTPCVQAPHLAPGAYRASAPTGLHRQPVHRPGLAAAPARPWLLKGVLATGKQEAGRSISMRQQASEEVQHPRSNTAHLKSFLEWCWGMFLVVAWMAIGVNLLRWDSWAKQRFFFIDPLTGNYTRRAAFLYSALGVLLVIFRYWPPFLVEPRIKAWQWIIRTIVKVTRPPKWYKPHAEKVMCRFALTATNLVATTLAMKLIYRIIPYVLELPRYLVPLWAGDTALLALDASKRRLIYEQTARLTFKCCGAVLAYLFGDMLVKLLHPSVSMLPAGKDEAYRGTSAFWRPIVWLSVQRHGAKGTRRMRVQLVDKTLTLVIYLAVVVAVFRIANLKLQTVLAVGGVGGLAIGLASQNLVQNLISGVLIYVNQSVCQGLEVVFSEAKVRGVISDVGWFNTTVNAIDGMRVVVPNRMVLEGTVVDRTNRRYRVCDETLLVVMEDPDQLSKLCLNVKAMMESHPAILQEAEVRKLQRSRGYNLKVYPPQFVLVGWSEWGVKFRFRGYFQRGMQGDMFLEEKSKLLLSVHQLVKDLGGRVNFFPAGVVPAAVASDDDNFSSRPFAFTSKE